MENDVVKIVKFEAAALGICEHGFQEERLGRHTLCESK